MFPWQQCLKLETKLEAGNPIIALNQVRNKQGNTSEASAVGTEGRRGLEREEGKNDRF